MVDGLVYVLANALVRYTVAGETPQPLGTSHPAVAPFQAFRTGDGWIVIAAANESLWRRLCAALGSPALAADRRFATNSLRMQNRATLVVVLEELLSKKGTPAWLPILEAAGVPASAIQTVDQAAGDPNLLHRGMIATIDQPRAGRMRIAGSPFRLSRTPSAVSAPAPLLGQHTAEVLRTLLGYDEGRIQRLRREAVVFTEEDGRR